MGRTVSGARTFRLNKLVRDKLVQINLDMGGEVDFKILGSDKLNQALVQKLIEEARELKNSELSAEELADLQEILDQLIRNLKVSKAEIKSIQAKKNVKNGGFKNGHYIKTLTLPADNKWAKYYAADPQRFPEVTGE